MTNNPEKAHARCCASPAGAQTTPGDTVRLSATRPATENAYPAAVARDEFEEQIRELRIREKRHTHEADAIAAARRRLPMVEVPADTPLTGPAGTVPLLDAFAGRSQLISYYMMWHPDRPAAEQCEGCTWNNSQMSELSYLHARDITYAVFSQGPYAESAKYHEFMGWSMPLYSAADSLGTLLEGRTQGMMHLVCYVRRGDRIFETYWTTLRGVEAVDTNFRLMDLTVWGRQGAWEDSPDGWPQYDHDGLTRIDGRPTAQWQRLRAGFDDALSVS